MDDNSFSSVSAADASSKKLRIYTRTGDGGTSALYTGERRQKDDDVFEALGSVDELNSAIGFANEFMADNDSLSALRVQLEKIQCQLQDLNSHIATPPGASQAKATRTEWDGSTVGNLEHWIDQYTEELPPLKNFILPSGGKSSASLHVARTICRRAERQIVKLFRYDYIHPDAMKYINRLSDFLFTVARYAAMKDGQNEKIYRK